MKKKGIILGILLVLIIGIGTILVIKNMEKPFYLEENYYGNNSMTEIKIDELNELINNKKSFAVFVYQPMCATSSDFEIVLSEFLEKNQISIYKIAFSNIRNTELGKTVKYFPSFIIYKKGKIIDFLEADKEEDINFYTSKEAFEKWFFSYVKK